MSDGQPNPYEDSFYTFVMEISLWSVDKFSWDFGIQVQKPLQKEFSRRCKIHEEKDVDSINDMNDHFNKKIKRAFGKYTLEIKNNFKRGTALPD